MDNLVLQALVKEAPMLVALLLLVTPLFLLMWRIYSSNMNFLDRWFDRHETAEEKQFDTLNLLRNSMEKLFHSFDTLISKIDEAPMSISSFQEPRMYVPTHEDGPLFGIPDTEKVPEIEMSANALANFNAERRSWEHQIFDIPALHAEGMKGDGIAVAILDTGVANHKDLADNFITSESVDVTGSPVGFLDRQGHGTHVAGSIASVENGDGLVGVAPKTKIVSYKCLRDADGSGFSSWIASQIRRAADNPRIQFLNCSFGSSSPDQQIHQAIKYAIGKNKIVVVAAGNSGPGSIDYPGAFEESLSVGALDQNLRPASFTSTNNQVDTASPGVQILSTYPNDRYAVLSGTSMATPITVGVLCLVFGELLRRGIRFPNQLELITAIKKTAKDLHTPGTDNSTGAGIIQIKPLISNLVTALGPVGPTPTPPPKPPESKKIVLEHPDLASLGMRVVVEIDKK